MLAEVTRLIGPPVRQALIVDDSETVRILLHDTLAAEYQIEMAEDSQVAIDILKRGWPDLIILDMLMPNVDGFTVMNWIHNDQHNLQIPIIAFSAAELAAGELQIVKELANAYTIKSQTSPQQLLDLINQVLARGR